MSRKHFEAMADTLAKLRPDCKPKTVKYRTWLNTVEAMASLCSGFNCKFDRYRFIHACKSRFTPVKGGE